MPSLLLKQIARSARLSFGIPPTYGATIWVTLIVAPQPTLQGSTGGGVFGVEVDVRDVGEIECTVTAFATLLE
jgi:hypothetical protein